jgi:hypothetical protein
MGRRGRLQYAASVIIVAGTHLTHEGFHQHSKYPLVARITSKYPVYCFEYLVKKYRKAGTPASRIRVQIPGSRCSLHRFQPLERTPRVPGYTDRRSLTILRKQIELEKLPPFTLSHYQGGGVGSKQFYESGRRIH